MFLQIADAESYESIFAFEQKLKVLIKRHRLFIIYSLSFFLKETFNFSFFCVKHSSYSCNDLYMYGIEYLTQYGIPVRSIRYVFNLLP